MTSVAGARLRTARLYMPMLVVMLLLGLTAVPASGIHEDQPEHPDSNEAGPWQEWLHDGSVCEKVADPSDPFVLGDPPTGYEWSLIVVNAGMPGEFRSTVTLDPEPGEYVNEQTGDVSNVILCKREVDEEGTGTLIIRKLVVGDPPDEPFEFSIVCDDGTKEIFDLQHNQTKEFDDLVGIPEDWEDGDPIWTCTVEETVHHGADSVSWVLTPSPGGGEPFGDTGTTVEGIGIFEDFTRELTFTNVFDEEITITENGTDSVDIELVKLWFDAGGNVVDQPGGDWAVTLTEHRGDQDIDRATLQGETTSATRSLVEGRDYTVTESGLPQGWGEVDGCEGLSIPDDTVAIGTGTFSADEGGLHVVCNQQAEVLAEVLEEEVEVLEELPRTGLPTTLLSLFGLLGIALGGGLLGRSRS